MDKSKIIKAVVLTKDDAAGSGIEGVNNITTAFKFIGTKSNISNARALMDYIVHSHNEIDSILVSSDILHPSSKQNNLGYHSTNRGTNQGLPG